MSRLSSIVAALCYLIAIPLLFLALFLTALFLWDNVPELFWPFIFLWVSKELRDLSKLLNGDT